MQWPNLRLCGEDIRERGLSPLLNHGCELANAASLLSEHVLGAGRADDDLSADGCHADLYAGVAFLGEFANKKLCASKSEPAERLRCLMPHSQPGHREKGKRGDWSSHLIELCVEHTVRDEFALLADHFLGHVVLRGAGDGRWNRWLTRREPVIVPPRDIF